MMQQVETWFRQRRCTGTGTERDSETERELGQVGDVMGR